MLRTSILANLILAVVAASSPAFATSLQTSTCAALLKDTAALDFELNSFSTAYATNANYPDVDARAAGKYFASLAKDSPQLQFRKALGFQKIKDYRSGTKKLILAPPSDWKVLFENYNELIDDQIRSGILKAENAIRPAIIFSEIARTPKHWYFYRPGYDPAPPVNTFFMYSGQIPDSVWSQALAAGKMPFSAHLIFHDVGHLEDFYSFPESLEIILAHHRRKAEKNAQGMGYDPDDVLTMTSADRQSFERYLIVSEVFSIPDIGKENEIRSYLARDNILGLEKFILPMGGISRDGYNRKRFAQLDASSGTTSYIAHYLNGIPAAFGQEIYINGIHQDLQGHISLIRELQTLSNDLTPLINVIRRAHLDIDETELRNLIKEAIASEKTRVATAFKSALALEMTPKKIFEDSFKPQMDKNSDTYQWLKSFIDPHSRIGKVFLKSNGGF